MSCDILGINIDDTLKMWSRGVEFGPGRRHNRKPQMSDLITSLRPQRRGFGVGYSRVKGRAAALVTCETETF